MFVGVRVESTATEDVVTGGWRIGVISLPTLGVRDAQFKIARPAARWKIAFY